VRRVVQELKPGYQQRAGVAVAVGIEGEPARPPVEVSGQAEGALIGEVSRLQAFGRAPADGAATISSRCAAAPAAITRTAAAAVGPVTCGA
jgi:hypothetical protein